MRHNQLRAQRLRLIHRFRVRIERHNDARHLGIPASEEQGLSRYPILPPARTVHFANQFFDIRNRASAHADRLAMIFEGLAVARKQPFFARGVFVPGLREHPRTRDTLCHAR